MCGSPSLLQRSPCSLRDTVQRQHVRSSLPLKRCHRATNRPNDRTRTSDNLKLQPHELEPHFHRSPMVFSVAACSSRAAHGCSTSIFRLSLTEPGERPCNAHLVFTRPYKMSLPVRVYVVLISVRSPQSKSLRTWFVFVDCS